METVRLGDTGLVTTILGYGCTGLMRPSSARERSALLEAAFDAGIRHFDVARYYGHGGAEGVLGEFLSGHGRRDQVTITTKFGLEPSAAGQSAGGRQLIALARRVASIHPAIRKILAARANHAVKSGCFDVNSASRSLETSLRELRTDRIDLFLLHEATLADTRSEGLLEFLESMVQAGKIRAFGLGTQLSHTREIIEGSPAFARVVQLADHVGQESVQPLSPDPGRLMLTHSVLRPLRTLEEALGGRRPGFDLRRDGQGSSLAGLLLGLAIHEHPQGVTLFSSVQPERIRQNVESMLGYSAVSAEEWAEFRQMAEQALSPASHVR